MPQLISDWRCIGTSGASVDGRILEPQWLIDCANTYSRETYTALLWPHHEEDIAMRQYTYNLGEVDALKYEEVNGKVKLYAKIIPNQFLIEANRLGQKLFTSVEVFPDFAGSGQNYLFGLAVTDIPNSLGTEKLSFTIDGETKEGTRGNVEAFSLGQLKSRESKPENKKPSFFDRLFSVKKEFTPDPDNNQPDQGEDETKMDELKALIEALTLRIQQMEEKANGTTADTPEEAATDVADLADEIADVADQVAEIAAEVADNPEDEVVAAEFSVAKKNLARLMTSFSAKGAPARRSRTRNHTRRAGRRQDFTARTPKPETSGNELTGLKDQLNTLLEKFSVLDARQTKVPNGAPSGGNKPFEFN
ncbi:TPA: GPO family capsid scaffolding protein [Yersinia enterocolitica]